MLRTCTTSTDTAALSLSAYKAAAKITTTSDDAILQSALDRATALIEGYIGYPLRRAVYEETVPAGGGNHLSVSRVPVQAIESIAFQGDVVAPTSYDIESALAGLVYRPLGWLWTAGLTWDLAPHVMPNSELRDFTVVYEAGYCTNGSTASGWLTTGEPVPLELETALISATTFVYRSATRDESVKSKKIGDLSITYQGGTVSGADGPMLSGGLPDTIKGILAPWRRF